jgi:hypothetical protein
MRALDFDFTDYLFVDSDHRATEALLHRIGSHPPGLTRSGAARDEFAALM